MKKILMSLAVAALLFLGIASASAAWFDWGSLVATWAVDWLSDDVSGWVGSFVSTIIDLAPYLIMMFFAWAIIGYLKQKF